MWFVGDIVLTCGRRKKRSDETLESGLPGSRLTFLGPPFYWWPRNRFEKGAGHHICDSSWTPLPRHATSQGVPKYSKIWKWSQISSGWIPDRSTKCKKKHVRKFTTSFRKWPLITLGAPPNHPEDSTVTKTCLKITHKCSNDHQQNGTPIVFFVVVSDVLFLDEATLLSEIEKMKILNTKDARRQMVAICLINSS